MTREGRFMISLLTSRCLFCFLMTVAVVAAQPKYETEELVLPVNGGSTQGYAINQLGAIAGTISDTIHQYGWYQRTSVDKAFFNFGHAYALNDNGKFGGDSDDREAWLAQANGDGTYTFIGDAFGNPAVVFGINNIGTIVGYQFVTPTINHAVMIRQGVYYDLGTLGGFYSSAQAVNDSDVVAGYAYTDTPVRVRAFIYDPVGGMRPLGITQQSSRAWGISANGSIVGEFSDEPYYQDSGRGHAFLYRAGIVTDLGTLGGAYSCAYGVNSAGDVVGWSDTANGERHGFLYHEGVLYDLNALIPNGSNGVIEARGINDKGQIVINTSLGRAFRLNPIDTNSGTSKSDAPLPTWSLIAIAGALLWTGAIHLHRTTKTA